MARDGDLDQIRSKRKAIIALLPYLVWRERVRDCRMVDAFLDIVRLPQATSMARPITMLLGEAGPDFPNRFVALMAPYGIWGPESNTNTVTRWAEAALAVPYSEEVGQSVIDALLQIASIDDLKPYIPVDIWPWLKTQPSLPPICRGRLVGTMGDVVRTIRGLGDVEISSRTCSLSGRSGTVFTRVVSPKCVPRSGRTLVESRRGAVGKFSLNGWTMSSDSWIGD